MSASIRRWATVQPWIASAAALIWVGLGANVGAAHELMHRHNPLAAFIGKLGFGIIGAPNRDISHTVTHHLYFDTERDFDTARRGESVYRFVPRCIWGNTLDEFDYERRRLAAQGLGLWHWKSQIVQGLALTVAVLAVMYWAGGVPALLVQLAAMIGGRILGEALNYLQHFGLLRVPGRAIEDRHTWNHLSAVTRILGLEITNHVEHHQDPDRPYYALKPRPQRPADAQHPAVGHRGVLPADLEPRDPAAPEGLGPEPRQRRGARPGARGQPPRRLAGLAGRDGHRRPDRRRALSRSGRQKTPARVTSRAGVFLFDRGAEYVRRILRRRRPPGRGRSRARARQ